MTAKTHDFLMIVCGALVTARFMNDGFESYMSNRHCVVLVVYTVTLLSGVQRSLDRDCVCCILTTGLLVLLC